MTSEFEFEVGDVVRLKGQCVPMTIERRVDSYSGFGIYRCFFFDSNNNLHQKDIDERCLIKVSDNEKDRP